MRFTPSRDGRRRATVRVEFRVGAADIRNAIAVAMQRRGEAAPKTRAAAQHMVRVYLERFGSEADLGTDILDFIDEAQEATMALFPELRES